MAGGGTERSIGYLGEIVEYEFRGADDARLYREERNRRALPGRILGLSCFFLLGGGLLYYSWLSFGLPYSLMTATGLLASLAVSNERRFGKTRYTRLVLNMRPGWIGFCEEFERRKPKRSPFTELVRYRAVRMVRWQADGCVIEYGRLVRRRMFIDRRLLAQEGAVEALEQWAEQHRVQIEGAAPTFA